MKFQIITLLFFVSAAAQAQGRTGSYFEGLNYDPRIFDPKIEIRYDKSYHSECVLKNSKPGLSNVAVHKISEACQTKAIPKICRNLEVREANACIETCGSKNAWARNFGECSVG